MSKYKESMKFTKKNRILPNRSLPNILEDECPVQVEENIPNQEGLLPVIRPQLVQRRQKILGTFVERDIFPRNESWYLLRTKDKLKLQALKSSGS